jgi:hypothetical protein
MGPDLLENNDLVRVHNRCEAVSNGNHSVVLEDGPQSLLNDSV